MASYFDQDTREFSETQDPLGVDPQTLASNMETAKGTGMSGNMMAAGIGVNLLSTIASGFMQSGAMRTQAAYAKQQSDFNSAVGDLQAKAAIDAGNQEAAQISRQGAAAVAQTRTQAAASGVDVNTGSSADVQTSQKVITGLDMLTAKNNAARQAWGYKVNAAQDQTEGNMKSIALNAGANATILGSGMNALGQGTQAYYYGSGGTIPNSRKSY